MSFPAPAQAWSHQGLRKVLAGPRHSPETHVLESQGPFFALSFSPQRDLPRGASPSIAGLAPLQLSCAHSIAAAWLFCGPSSGAAVHLSASSCFLITTALGHVQHGNEG